MRRFAGLVIAGLVMAAVPALAVDRTEAREPCTARDALRRPFFGDTHVHTALSFDAVGQGTRNRPADAYRFARGEPIGLPPYTASGEATRTLALRRPLDFAVVTDHSELLGETHMCTTPSSDGYDSFVCIALRRWPTLTYATQNGRIFASTAPEHFSFCGENGRVCLDAARAPWQETQDAAEAAYDRTSACAFTSFVGYEWTGMPNGNNAHRNLVFRNAEVPALPTSYLDETHESGLWAALERDCLDRDGACDVIAIPHNSNVSNGLLFRTSERDGTPLSQASASRRARLERLVEVTQHKGDSECRAGGPVEDELCGFETLPYPRMSDSAGIGPIDPIPPLSYVRETLIEGLAQEARVGVNPFKLGLIGSTDTHTAAAGSVDEDAFPGHAAGLVTARLEAPPIIDAPDFNPGGLAVVWAEENSRDALFEAMHRRETYGTSGPRMQVRFFGGWDTADDVCESGDFVARGYASGVPMGGDLAARAGDVAPGFAVWARKDAGTAGHPGTPLQQVQIVKGWIANGEHRERVYTVAGDPDNGASVALSTCEPEGRGFDELCSVWRDPDFDAQVPAVYYTRVVENPSCRWTQFQCNAAQVRCAEPSTIPDGMEACCDDDVPRTIQERAWTSPIWYTPKPEAAR